MTNAVLDREVVSPGPLSRDRRGVLPEEEIYRRLPEPVARYTLAVRREVLDKFGDQKPFSNFAKEVKRRYKAYADKDPRTLARRLAEHFMLPQGPPWRTVEWVLDCAVHPERLDQVREIFRTLFTQARGIAPSGAEEQQAVDDGFDVDEADDELIEREPTELDRLRRQVEELTYQQHMLRDRFHKVSAECSHARGEAREWQAHAHALRREVVALHETAGRTDETPFTDGFGQLYVRRYLPKQRGEGGPAQDLAPTRTHIPRHAASEPSPDPAVLGSGAYRARHAEQVDGDLTAGERPRVPDSGAPAGGPRLSDRWARRPRADSGGTADSLAMNFVDLADSAAAAATAVLAAGEAARAATAARTTAAAGSGRRATQANPYARTARATESARGSTSGPDKPSDPYTAPARGRYEPPARGRTGSPSVHRTRPSSTPRAATPSLDHLDVDTVFREMIEPLDSSGRSPSRSEADRNGTTAAKPRGGYADPTPAPVSTPVRGRSLRQHRYDPKVARRQRKLDERELWRECKLDERELRRQRKLDRRTSPGTAATVIRWFVAVLDRVIFGANSGVIFPPSLDAPTWPTSRTPAQIKPSAGREPAGTRTTADAKPTRSTRPTRIPAPAAGADRSRPSWHDLVEDAYQAQANASRRDPRTVAEFLAIERRAAEHRAAERRRHTGAPRAQTRNRAIRSAVTRAGQGTRKDWPDGLGMLVTLLGSAAAAFITLWFVYGL